MRVKIDLEDYNYYLPRDLIAKYPASRREESRLMVLNREENDFSHKYFYQLVDYLKPGDLLVRNISKVVPARIYGFRELTGGKVEILPLEIFPRSDSVFSALVKCRGRLKEREKILLPGDRYAVYLGKNEGTHNVKFEFSDLLSYLYEYGNIPLPPYIKRRIELGDRERYQTVYAKNAGSVAAPTAGLHFSKKLLREIEKRGVKFADLVLHVSYATFKPLTEKELSSGRLYKEYFEISPESAEKINRVKREGGRVIAVGTTSVRALESQAYVEGQKADKLGVTRYRLEEKRTEVKINPGQGETDLFIYPGYKFKIVDALLTNFHLPRTSLLLLISAFAGKAFLFSAYKEAVKRKYRFYSYGDCMLII